jgi:hypothetical protein
MAAPISTQHRDGSRHGVRLGPAERHQTALRGQATASFRSSDCRRQPATPQKPLRADEPVKQNGELDPQGGDGCRQAHSGGIETSVSRERLPSAASAQLGCTRSSGRIGGRGSIGSRSCSAGAGPRANPNATGSGVCRTATLGIVVPQERSPGRGRRGAPVRQAAPRAGPVVTSEDRQHLLLLRGYLGRHTPLHLGIGAGWSNKPPPFVAFVAVRVPLSRAGSA